MDRHKAIDILGGDAGGVGGGLLRAGLSWASIPYAAAMRMRRWAYRRGLLPRRRAGAPVICVGNLTTGGTGKTPMVAWVVEHLKGLGRHPAILTRGYKAAAGLSDEAELLRQLTGAAVVIDPDRAAAAARAVADGADVLVMDDGFQHLRLRRDLDVVLIDAINPFGFGRCLPRGLMREPPSALADAHAVVITHSDSVEAEHLAELRGELARLAPAAAFCAAVHRPTKVIDGSGVEAAPDALAGRKVFAFCGIACPESFVATLDRLGAAVAGVLELADHAVYTPQILQSIAAEAERADATAVTTQKDYVKLARLDLPLPIWQLAVTMEIADGEADLRRVIDSSLQPG